MDLSPDDDDFQGRLLHQAALWDNVELLQELLSTGADMNALDEHGRSALHAAALAERSQCLVALVEAGADVDLKSDEVTGGKTALHIAAERGHAENILALLAAGASLEATDARGDTALALAERLSHRHAARQLQLAHDALERERLAAHAQLRELVVRGDTAQLKAKLQALGASAGIVANLTPGGANTLLYVASEAGLTSAVAALLDAGADGRAHPVTKYSPLYIASYHGHAEIAKLLLAHFPRGSQQETVEKWLPLHAACIGGHPSMVTLLLDYPYPEIVLNTYTDSSGRWQYRAAFDVNARDASGQTALYVACTLGNRSVVDALLAHTVCATPVQIAETEDAAQPAASPQQVTSPTRAGISLGIHALVSKLTGGGKKETPSETRIRPVRVECGRGADSCVAAAVRGGHAAVLQRLLSAGASADASAVPPHSTSESGAKRRSRSACPVSTRRSASPLRISDRNGGAWTALALAARLRHASIARTLLTAGAVDSARALQEAAAAGLHDLIPLLLATKAYADPDYKLNKSALSESVFSDRRDPALTYSAVCPTTPVMVNWRELRCHLAQIRMSWLRTAALRVNPKLSASSGAGLLHALTRLDVSNNELRELPPELFTLLSLRYLNAAQNKLDRLPTLTDTFEEEDAPRGRRKKKRRAEVYSAPVLQELYLQDNRLEELPPELFSLPALTTLDVSNNKLRALPAAMWHAPALRDLNAALNHLKDLPTDIEGTADADSVSVSDTSSQRSASPTSDRSSFQKSWSRSPSIEVSETSSVCDASIPTLGDRTGNAVGTGVVRAHTWRGCVSEADPLPAAGGGGSSLSALNLSHNQFTCVPHVLPCAAPALQRLNMAYNSLRSMSYVTSYPRGLRQLDLSHNEITCWPSLPQVETLTSSEDNPLMCYCPRSSGGGNPRGRPRSGGSVRAQLLNAACKHRSHLRLEAIRTLILANNMLTRIQLTTDDDGEAFELVSLPKDDMEWNNDCVLGGRLLFPLLSMLDVSCNLLRCVPPGIHQLTNLAVLNISGNKDITDLPPTMGLLSRLWNLNASGCCLQEPLHSMLCQGKYKSMDVIGYLKSKLQEARPYTRLKLMLAGVQGIGKTSLLECLRQESAIHHRRKPTDHWAKRMGNKSSRRGGNMSTVGVDIGTWVYEKQRSTRGPVTFRTWDFGGQQEYYATHQYFLSRRSLYLVVWKVTDGKKGLAEAIDWLRSIQARAPGAPVIMVATHYDQVPNSNLPESESPEALQRLIRSSIMGACDADKLGLPRVMDSLEVSCSTRHNIRLLADIIYSVAFSVKPPGSKEPLLEQLVPATYLALEECVTSLASELVEPVVRHEEYKRLVTQYMQQKGLRMFRDGAELHQATMFLHENGVLLHYDDATLKELYFLRPQWLCDVLAHVVTVREINPFASNGIMKIEDLAHVFKASPQLLRGEEASSLGVSLLNKFELALCWDSRLLLVPPLLPVSPPQHTQLPLRPRQWNGPGRGPWAAQVTPLTDPARPTDSPTLIHDSPTNLIITGRSGGFALRRLLLLSYIPCGFWARLCTRLLSDASLRHAPPLYTPPPEMELDEAISSALDLNWGWKLWRSGLALVCGELTLLAVRERRGQHPTTKIRLKQEGSWCDLDLESSACVEILLPAQVCVVRRQDNTPIGAYQSISLEPSNEVLAKVLALVSEHVDLLLEDWYPSLGTRFVHTSEGRCLITRVVPCPACLRDLRTDFSNAQGPPPLDVVKALRRLDLEHHEPRRLRLSEESRASDGDSGVGAESNASSRIGSVEGVADSRETQVAYGWSVEECILCACTGQPLHCPHHDIRLRDVAPDTLLLDIECEKRARWEHISRGAVCGRGAQGTVSAGVWRQQGRPPQQVAIKTLQPVPPPASSDTAALHAYKAALSRWERDPSACACRAYQAMRQEVSILCQLRHPHVVPLLAVCGTPLALLLELAPQGALDGVLRSYRDCGVRVGVRAARALATQAARALEYLHARRIVYRDLKSENVLVWAMPRPQQAASAERALTPINVLVKLADYGISRMAPPSGTKGFGGTEGFMAPEIMRYNGEEEYNEKVDCFSFGMLLYEIVTLRQPFEGHEAVKEAILEGARPTLTPKEVQYPCCMLEMMRRCWGSAPTARPSAAALVCLCAAPEFPALQDAAALSSPADNGPLAVAHTPLADNEEGVGGWEVWYAGGGDRVNTLVVNKYQFTHQYTFRVPPDESEPVTVTAMCRVGHTMWVGDSGGRVTVYSIATCSVLWSARATDSVGGAACAVCALQPLPALQRVALALTNGRLFLVTSHQPEPEGSFVLTELGTATELCCLEGVPTPHGFEVWAGGDSLYVYTVGNTGVCSADTLPAQPRVTLLAAPLAEPCILTYTHPGVCVYQWCIRTKQLTGKLDCSKLAPCSESLQSIAIDGHLSEERCRQETVEKWLPLHAACIGGHPSMVTLLLDYPYPEIVLNTYTDSSGRWQYRAAFDVNARDASGQTALYVACTLGNRSVVDALLAHTVCATPVQIAETEDAAQPAASPQQVTSPTRAGISLGIHALVSKLTGGGKKVTSLCVSGSSAYIGTAWGCVVVAHCGTLRPLCVCRPLEEQIRAMIPLPAHWGVSSGSEEDRLVTLGQGYRPLLNRFTQANSTTVDYSGFYGLLWRTHQWLPD